MREAFDEFTIETADEAESSTFARHLPARVSASSPAAAGTLERSAYGERRFGWRALLAVGIGHALALAAILSYGIAAGGPAKQRPPLVIDLLELPADPPSATPQPPEKANLLPASPKQPEIFAPTAVVHAPVATRQVATAIEAPPPYTVVAAPTVAAPGPPAPVAAGDLSTTMISAKPPKYPMESRRKREQGTVVLTVLVGISGNVDDVDVSRSSGFARLDTAALNAVKHWRWAPIIRNGQPVAVRGIVPIPFVLEG